MAISASDVKTLREMTGVGMMDCKKALTEANGNLDRAVEILREKGIASATKKGGRIAAEGIVESYIHMGGKIGVLIEVNCETDFVAKTPEFKSFVRDVAMHVAAANPQYLSREEVPADVLEKEREILRAQARNEGKPEKIIEKMVEGRIVKFYKEVCLLEQAFVKDADVSVGKMIEQKAKGLNIVRFTRYKMGDGLEKKVNDLAAEVAEQIGSMQK